MKGPSADILDHVTLRTTPAEFKQLLAGRSEDINGFMPDMEDQCTLLMFVSAFRNACAVKLLLDCNADPNITADDGSQSALDMVVTRYGHFGFNYLLDHITLLIEYGANVNYIDYRGVSTLLRAIWACSTIVIETLMDAGAVIDEDIRYRGFADVELPYRKHVFVYAERVAARIRACRRALCAFFVASSSGGGNKDTTRAIMRVVWERERRNRAWEEVAPLPGEAGEGSKN